MGEGLVIRRSILMFALAFLLLLFLNPSEGVAAPLPYQSNKPSQFIHYPCLSGVSEGVFPVQFICQGVTELASGRIATITFPTPRITARVPKLSIVAIPTFMSLSWDPDSFSYSDLIIPEYEFVESGVENKLINVHYELRVTPDEGTAATFDVELLGLGQTVGQIGNVTFQNPTFDTLHVGIIEDRADVFGTVPYPYCHESDTTVISNIPIQYGGFAYPDNGCRNILSMLPPPETANPTSLDGYNFPSPPYGIDGQVLAYWTQYASTRGTSSSGSHPAFELSFVSFWKVEARVSWDMHLIRNGESDGGEEIIDCRWEYWEDPDAYIDWSQHPPFCKRIVVASEGWETYCVPGSDEPGEECNYGSHGNDPDDWWQTISTYVVQAVLTPDGEYADRYSFVVLQAQPLLNAP
jgi:hypothetical protein